MHLLRIATAASVALTAACLAGPSAATGFVAHAHVTINLQYDEHYKEDRTTGDEHDTGNEDFQLSGSLDAGAQIEATRYGISLGDVPEEQLTAGDRLRGSASLSYAAKAESTDHNGSLEGDKTFKANASGNDGNEITGGVDDAKDGMMARFSVTVDGPGRCHYEIHGDGPSLSRDSCDGNTAGGRVGALTNASDGENGATGSFDFDARVFTGKEKAGAKQGAIDANDGDWYGAKLAGDAAKGYMLTKDETRKFSDGQGISGSKHLHLVAKITVLSRVCTIDERDVALAYSRAFAARHVAVPPAFLTANEHDEHFLSYAVRLTGGNALLPTRAWVTNAVAHGAKPQPGAGHLLLGAVQIQGERFRVTARIVETETGEVQAAGRGNGSGCERGLENAVAAALSAMKTPIGSYHRM